MLTKTPPFLIITLCLLASCAALRPEVQSSFDTGMAFFNRSQYDRAIPHFVKATELDPEFAPGYLYLGRSYLNLSRWLDAVAPLRTALRLSPEEMQKEAMQLLIDALLGAAMSTFKRGDAQQAVSIFKEVLDLAPQSEQVRQHLIAALLASGSKLLAQGNISEAVAFYTEATQLAPQNFEAYLGLARAFLQSGEFFQALMAANNALRLSPHSDDALSLLQQLQGRR